MEVEVSIYRFSTFIEEHPCWFNSILKTDSVKKIPTEIQVHFFIRHQFYTKD